MKSALFVNATSQWTRFKVVGLLSLTVFCTIFAALLKARSKNLRGYTMKADIGLKILFMQDMAFLDIHREYKGLMLCIGTEKEVREAESEKLSDIIREAFATSDYMNIESARDLKLH